jgi:hypothetical protein
VSRAVNGTTSTLTRADQTELRVAFPMTVSFWWKGTVHANFTYMLSKVVTAGDHPSYGFSFSNAGEARFLVAWGTNPSEFTATSTTAGSANLYDGNWHRVTGTYDGTTVTCYVDNTSIGTASENRALQYAALSLQMGSFDGTQLFTTGSIADVAIWSAALNTSDIASLTAGFVADLIRPDKLVAYWPLIGRTSPEIELKKAMDLTVTSATQDAHPRLINGSASSAVTPPTSAATLNADAASTVTDTLTSTATVTRPVDAASSITNTRTATSTVTRPVDAASVVTDTLTATATATRPVDAAQVVTDTLAAVASVDRPVTAALSVTDTLIATGDLVRPISGAATVTDTLASTATVSRNADAVLTVTNTLAATATVTRNADAALVVTNTRTATALIPTGNVTSTPQVGYRRDGRVDYRRDGILTYRR